MKRELALTKDGSPTLYLPEWDEHFHSHNGAWQESQHIFVGLGLHYLAQKHDSLSVLEMGYGTGLNALLAWIYSQENNVKVNYTGIEKYPVSAEEFEQLSKASTDNAHQSMNDRLFGCEWGRSVKLNDRFCLHKREEDMLDYEVELERYNLVYMDAFDPELQPELWSVSQFQKIYNSIKTGGVLTTYSVKGWVKRNLKQVGFKIEKHPGPPGKREVLRAIKL